MTRVENLSLPMLEVSESQAEKIFAGLQDKLHGMWSSMRTLNDTERTVVVVPSQTTEFNVQGAEMQAYEERFLFLLLLLRQPRVRLVYVTSQTILPSTVVYYLNLLPDTDPEEARRRLFLVAPEDRSDRPLVTKLLERPRLVARVRDMIPDPEIAHLVTYVTTRLEQNLALLLGIPVYGADPRFVPYGTKSGCRRLFAEEGIRHPIGFENLASVSDLVEALVRMRKLRPSLASVMIKLNDGISGEGNGVIDLRGLPPSGADEELGAIDARLADVALECAAETFEGYMDKLERLGGVVEERLVGDDLRSPSVQLRNTPLGETELLSTHDQVLGGPSGQSYLGCCFPADPGYAAEITRAARKLGQRLAAIRVMGRFAVDFLVLRNAERQWEAYAIELNLRKGGTTHPYLTLEFLTDGAYDPEQAVFSTLGGTGKYYVASDHLESPLYRALCPGQLENIARRHGLHYCRKSQTGVVFHMLATLAENGRLGVTAIADSPGQARTLFEALTRALDTEARNALKPVSLAEA